MNIDGIDYSGPELDENQLNDLIGPVGSADIRLLEELLSIFGQESEGILESIEQAVSKGDRDALRKGLHNLAGSSSNVGMIRLSRLAVQAENLLPDMDDAVVADLYPFFREEYDHALQSVRSRYGLS